MKNRYICAIVFAINASIMHGAAGSDTALALKSLNNKIVSLKNSFDCFRKDAARAEATLSLADDVIKNPVAIPIDRAHARMIKAEVYARGGMYVAQNYDYAIWNYDKALSDLDTTYTNRIEHADMLLLAGCTHYRLGRLLQQSNRKHHAFRQLENALMYFNMVIDGKVLSSIKIEQARARRVDIYVQIMDQVAD